MKNDMVMDDLVSPHKWADFSKTLFGHSPVHLKGAADRFEELFSLNSVDEVLNRTPHPHPQLKLYKEGAPVSVSGPADVQAAINAGATLIVENIDRFHPPLSKLTESITAETWIPVRLNMYLSQAGTMGYKLHYDTHDFLALQVDGCKEWSVYPATIEAPLYFDRKHGTVPPPSDELILRCVLEPGDVLYVPRGFWHGATASGGSSLHLTLALFERNGIDVLTWLTDQMRDSGAARRSLPPLHPRTGSADDMAVAAWLEQFAVIKRELDELLASPETVRQFAADYIGNQRPRQPFSVAAPRPFAPEAEVVFVPRHVPLVADLRRGVVCVFGHQLDFSGLPFPPAPVLKSLLDGGQSNRALAERYAAEPKDILVMMETLALHGAGDLEMVES